MSRYPGTREGSTSMRDKPIDARDTTLVGETGERPTGVSALVAALGAFVLSVVLGMLIGFFVAAMLWLMNLGIGFIWAAECRYGDIWVLPLLICPAGGLVIGWLNHRFHAGPEELEKVLAEVKRTGRYRVGNVPAAIISFLLPLIFGGSVGPEAGLTGFIAAGATRISATLQRAGLRVMSLPDATVAATICAVFGAPFGGFVLAAGFMSRESPDDRSYFYRRPVKAVLYGLAAAGAFLGLWLASKAIGYSGGLPRLEATDGFIPHGLWWIGACIAAGYLLALVFGAAGKGFGQVARRLDGHDVAMGLIAGVMLGVTGVVLPLVLFSGEEQMRDIANAWQTLSALALVVTAMVKCVLTPLCIQLGWKGGSIFPCIFCGTALGLGIAALSGADPIFCAACTCAAFMGAKMQKPVFAAALLLLCFPPSVLPWLVLAAIAGRFIPLPRALRKEPRPPDTGTFPL